MNENKFKYELRKGNGSMRTVVNLNWFERMKYRLKGYKIIKLS